jgi:hypothetical protein
MISHLALRQEGARNYKDRSQGRAVLVLFLQPGLTVRYGPLPLETKVCMAGDPVIIYPKAQIPLTLS